jgi:hypothetical protein
LVRTELAVLLLVIILFAPAARFAEAQDFFPRLYSSEGQLELDMHHERDVNTADGSGVRETNTVAVEKLRITMIGFLYHPRFIQFNLMGAGGVSQERDESNILPTYRKNDIAPEYDARIKFLPEHPYNLELYTWRMTTLGQGKFSADTRPTNIEKGVNFKYAEKPLFLNMSYNSNTIESNLYRTDSWTRRVSGSYLLGPTVTGAGYNNTHSSSSTLITTVRDESFVNNTITLKNASLLSEVKDVRLDQNSPITGKLITDTAMWTELFSASLPLNLSTSFSYGKQKDKFITSESPSAPVSETINDTQNSGLMVSHRLYDSVRTNYTHNNTLWQSTGGETKTVLDAVAGTYTKRIPRGRLTANVLGSRMKMHRDNASNAFAEYYNASLNTYFALTKDNIDRASIVVRIIHPDTGELLDLVENVNYYIQPTGNSYLINIIALPFSITSGRPFGYIYTFLVTYSLLPTTVELRTDTVGYSFYLALFDNLINPYYNHLTVDQTVLTGSIPGGPMDSVTDIVGISIQQVPYLFLTELRKTQSDSYPSEQYRNVFEYLGQLDDTTTLDMKLQYILTHYYKGAVAGTTYTEHIESLDARLQKAIPRSNINLSLSGTYSQRHSGAINTNLISATGAVIWYTAQLTVTAGASIYDSTSSSSYGTQQMISEYYFVRVTRKLW